MQRVQWQIPTGFHKIIVSGPLTPPEGFRVMLSWKIDAERIAAATCNSRIITLDMWRDKLQYERHRVQNWLTCSANNSKGFLSFFLCFFNCTFEPLSVHGGWEEFDNFPRFLVGSDNAIVPRRPGAEKFHFPDFNKKWNKRKVLLEMRRKKIAYWKSF